MRFTVFCLLFLLTTCSAVYAQHDSLATADSDQVLQKDSNSVLNSVDPKTVNPFAPDSLDIYKASRQQLMADSIAMIYLVPDTLYSYQVETEIYNNHLLNISPASYSQVKQKDILMNGDHRNSREPWVIAAIISLLIYTALLNIFLSADIRNVIQSFYNKHALSQLDKEGGLINSWAFIGLFILFSLTSGLVLYQLTVYYNVYYDISGFQLFILLSVVIGLLFALKFTVLKFIGFVFDIKSLISQYIAILNLTYFSIAFVLLSVALCFCLLDSRFIPPLFFFTMGSIAIIFAWQYIRNSVNIISNFRFHKFYLFIYLCALEICPILILIKALNI
jgi:hypothetical protein